MTTDGLSGNAYPREAVHSILAHCSKIRFSFKKLEKKKKKKRGAESDEESTKQGRKRGPERQHDLRCI